MDGEPASMMIPERDPVAVALRLAVHAGDLGTITNMLAEHPGLAQARFVAPDGGAGTALHMVADWPGYFPNGREVVELLIRAGADPDYVAAGPDGGFAETPLHGAASSDDAEVAAALIDGGASLEARGGSIAGGTPLTNAVGYGCWHVAWLLVRHGARIGSLSEAAALGNRPAVDDLLAADPPPTAADIDEAFWQACHGGQRRMAEYLLAHGANINARPDYARQTPLQVATAPDTQRQGLAEWLREHGATEA